MKISALILAAGVSQKMENFKPMVNIGHISIIQRILLTFQQAGIRNIIVVTGEQSEELERHIAHNGVICLENQGYQTSEMLDSVKIGLAYLQGKSERIVISPADIPFFTADTVKKLCDSRSRAAIPTYSGTAGHPIVVNASVIPQIITYSGENGLSGAIANLSPEHIPVKDRGILFDVEMHDDYYELLDYHNRQFVHPEIKVSICREKPFLGEQGALLLQLIGESQSVRGSCAKMGISYSKCWKILNIIAEQTGKPIVKTFPGGSGGGRTCLTEYGRDLLHRYWAYQEEIYLLANQAFQKFFGSDFL